MRGDIFGIMQELKSLGHEVQAKLTVGDPKHRRTPPPEETRRLARMQELLEHLAAKDPAEMKKLIAETRRKDPLNLTHAKFLQSIADNPKELSPERLEELQKLLYIEDKDLTIANLDKYIRKVLSEIEEKANFWDVGERDLPDDFKVVKLKNRDLHLNNKIEEPDTVFDLVREVQEVTKWTLDKTLTQLFGANGYKTVLALGQPMQTATEINALRDATVHFMDHNAPGWEGHLTLVFIREIKTASLVIVNGHEETAVKKAAKKYRQIINEHEGNFDDDD
jgi:hypothetical protein